MTYRSRRYPAELIDVVHLTGGERVVIRPVLPQDRELLVRFFCDLSPAARCRRFMHPVNEPSLKMLRQFTQVDRAGCPTPICGSGNISPRRRSTASRMPPASIPGTATATRPQS
jgi:hypothetical protein